MLKFGNTFVNVGGTYLTGIVSQPAPVGDEVTIGTQTWRNQDLSGTDGGTGISVVDGNYYYTLAAAQRLVPDGWHIPTIDEYGTLLSYIGTNSCQKLKTTTGWLDKEPGDGGGTGNGTDEYDFHGAPVGFNYDNTVNGIGKYVYYMTTTTGSIMNPYYSHSQYMYTLLLDRDENGASLPSMGIDSSTYFAVRLIKD